MHKKDYSVSYRRELLAKKLKAIDIIESKMQVKIADLGLARQLLKEDLTESDVGTPLTKAPEVGKGLYDHKVDVWSLGIIYYELLTGFVPFKANSKALLKETIEKGVYHLPLRINLSVLGVDFLNCCL